MKTIPTLRLVALAAAAVMSLPAPAADTTTELNRALKGLSSEQLAEMESIVLRGQVSEADLLVLRDDMPALRTLDLKLTYLTDIPARAFAAMPSLEEIILPNNCHSIGNAAFLSCQALKEITLPKTVTTIGNLAFARSGLTTFTVGPQVESLGSDAFFGCNALATIAVDEANTAYCTVDGALYTADRTRLLKCPPLAAGSVTFADELTRIDDNACAGCSSVTFSAFPAGLRSIGDNAFSGCRSISGTLAFPASVESIGNGAFFNATGVSGTLDYPAKAVGTSRGVFSYMTGISRINIPAGCDAIPESTFECCRGVRTIQAAPMTPPEAGLFALRSIDRSTTSVIVDPEAVDSYRDADTWSEFSSYNSAGSTYTTFSVNGDYRIVYIGDDADTPRYVKFNDSEYGALASLTDNADDASLWNLEFFDVTASALSFAGERGSDIRYTDGTNYCHINKEARCYTDPRAGYTVNNNRTFAFFVLDADNIPAEGPTVAIIGNGTAWRANSDLTGIATDGFSNRYPTRRNFVFRLEPAAYTAAEIADADAAPCRYYDLRGIEVAHPRSGIYIAVTPDGKATKVKF